MLLTDRCIHKFIIGPLGSNTHYDAIFESNVSRGNYLCLCSGFDEDCFVASGVLRR